MNKYIAYYRDHQTVVEAETLYEAKLLAVAQLRPRKAHEVHVYLAELNGQVIEHSTGSL